MSEEEQADGCHVDEPTADETPAGSGDVPGEAEAVSQEREEVREGEDGDDIPSPLASKEMVEVIQSDLAHLTGILEENPSLADQIYDICEINLALPLSRESYERFMVSLRVLVGGAGSRIITESAKIVSRDFFTELRRTVGEDQALQGTIALLQHLTALYGTRIKDAFFLSFRHMEHDWRTAEVSLLRKGEGEQWFVEMELTKYQGEEILLRMTPVSALQLAHLMLSELQKLPEDAVDDQLLQQFREGIAGLRTKFTGRSTSREETRHLDGYA